MMKALPHRAGSVRETAFAVLYRTNGSIQLGCERTCIVSGRHGVCFSFLGVSRHIRVICIDSAGVEAQE